MEFRFRTALLIVLLICVQCKDPYSILGVARDASERQIKSAYKKLALRYHPDKNPNTQNKFIEIQHAYETLTDPTKRQQYEDQQRHSQGRAHFNNYGQGGRHYQQQQQQQQQQYRQHQYNTWEDTRYDTYLPSNTTTLTSSNFRNTVHYSNQPWLVMIYSHVSEQSKLVSGVWEVAWKQLSSKDKWVMMGRVHWQHQQRLVHYLSQGLSAFGFPVTEDSLPVIIGIPSSCRDWKCMIKFRGEVTVSSLTDFVADELLRMPSIPALKFQDLDAFLSSQHSHKVVALVFAKTSGSGSLSLRKEAQDNDKMMSFARVHLQEDEDTAAWRKRISENISASTVVFLRGPGSSPDVVAVGGSAGSLHDAIHSTRGFSWQGVPALWEHTASTLGCSYGAQASNPTHDMMQLCVVLVGKPGPGLDNARSNIHSLMNHLAMPSLPPEYSALATEYMGSRVRFAWVDALQQQGFCRHHFQGAGPDVLRAVCGGQQWWEKAYEAVRKVLNWHEAESKVHVVAYKPKGQLAKWVRRKNRHLFAINMHIDIATPQLPISHLEKLASWCASVLTAHENAIPFSTPFPPPLQPQGIETQMQRLMHKVTRAFRSAEHFAQEIGLWGAYAPYFSLVVIGLALLLLHVAWYNMARPKVAVQPGRARAATAPPVSNTQSTPRNMRAQAIQQHAEDAKEDKSTSEDKHAQQKPHAAEGVHTAAKRACMESGKDSAQGDGDRTSIGDRLAAGTGAGLRRRAAGITSQSTGPPAPSYASQNQHLRDQHRHGRQRSDASGSQSRPSIIMRVLGVIRMVFEIVMLVFRVLRVIRDVCLVVFVLTVLLLFLWAMTDPYSFSYMLEWVFNRFMLFVVKSFGFVD